MVLEDQYKQAFEELKQKRESLKTNFPSPEKMKQDQHYIKLLENQLDKALKSFNDLQSGNRGLRGQIDVMRKEQENQNRSNAGYMRDIKATVEAVKKLNALTQSGSHESEQTQN